MLRGLIELEEAVEMAPEMANDLARRTFKPG
jgi:hypothetical protein